MRIALWVPLEDWILLLENSLIQKTAVFHKRIVSFRSTDLAVSSSVVQPKCGGTSMALQVLLSPTALHLANFWCPPSCHVHTLPQPPVSSVSISLSLWTNRIAPRKHLVPSITPCLCSAFDIDYHSLWVTVSDCLDCPETPCRQLNSCCYYPSTATLILDWM